MRFAAAAVAALACVAGPALAQDHEGFPGTYVYTGICDTCEVKPFKVTVVVTEPAGRNTTATFEGFGFQQPLVARGMWNFTGEPDRAPEWGGGGMESEHPLLSVPTPVPFAPHLTCSGWTFISAGGFRSAWEFGGGAFDDPDVDRECLSPRVSGAPGTWTYTPAVPEPGTWAMLLLGLLALHRWRGPMTNGPRHRRPVMSRMTPAKRAPMTPSQEPADRQFPAASGPTPTV